MTQHPEVLWAQRSSETADEKNVVYLTVNLPDIQEQTLVYDLTPTSISFKARHGNSSKGISEKDYEFNLELFAEVVPELSTKKLTTRSFSVTLRKKEKKEEYWPRLTKDKVKNAFLKTDFSKWVDEDEQDGVAAIPDDGDDAPGMGGMGGMGGMEGMGGMPPGMDFQKMLAQMGGGGAGGMPDFGGAGPSDGGDDEDSDDDGPPPLEEAEPAK
ncbi:hypothetical protein D9615_006380 [Tricholomella constricta]|uniref:CS domain-containing protein n=1 Tax=Tricholomella constricta TaxID=117010 RepID=A0A8H5M1E2_9AGAR|nr:hypothetical protein D9615_006380 [Tricholomella constricta]